MRRRDIGVFVMPVNSMEASESGGVFVSVKKTEEPWNLA